MSYQQFQKNWQVFSELIDHIPTTPDPQANILINSYIEQNLSILNDVLSISIHHLNKLKQMKNAHDVLTAQTTFTSEISQHLALSTQKFLNTCLGRIADYNEWLKSNCEISRN